MWPSDLKLLNGFVLVPLEEIGGGGGGGPCVRGEGGVWVRGLGGWSERPPARGKPTIALHPALPFSISPTHNAP